MDNEEQKTDRASSAGAYPAEACSAECLYEIVVEGELDQSWSGWLNGMRVQVQKNASGASFTRLEGIVADQSSLRGILTRIWDLNLELVSVNRMDDPLVNWRKDHE
ncbi:MAG: hypothetical protein AB1894_10105 [Chloroflexota bacterium]